MREESRRFVIGISIVAALILGLFYWSRSDVKPRTLPPSAKPLQAVAVEPALEKPKPAPAQIATAPQIAPVRAQPAPAPVAQAPAEKIDRIEFPSSLRSQFTAAGFHDAFTRVVAECKFDYAVDSEDCTEYPCVEWGTSTGNHIDVGECPAWKETFGENVFVFTHDDTDGHHYMV